MDIFVIFTIGILVALLVCSLIFLVSFIKERRSIKKTTRCFNKYEFDEIVSAGYIKQNQNLKSGDIKMNILTNDAKGNNEILIMDKFRKMLNSSMFDELSKISGDSDLWKI